MDGRHHQIIYFFDQILEAEKMFPSCSRGPGSHAHGLHRHKAFPGENEGFWPPFVGMKDRFGWKKLGQPVEVGSISQRLFMAFLHPKCCKISSINRNSLQVVVFFHPNPVVYTYSHAWGLGFLKIRLLDPLRLKGSVTYWDKANKFLFEVNELLVLCDTTWGVPKKSKEKSLRHWGVFGGLSDPCSLCWLRSLLWNSLAHLFFETYGKSVTRDLCPVYVSWAAPWHKSQNLKTSLLGTLQQVSDE